MTAVPPSRWSHSKISVFDATLTVVDFGERLLIGAQVASLLKRETFNMYRSMKIKRIDIRRANPAEVAFLVKAEAVRVGTHSVTLIPLEKGLYFIADATVRTTQCPNCECCAARVESKAKSFLSARPKIHRRKPLPWNVHRSLRREDLLRIEAEGFPSSDAFAPSSPLRSSSSAASSSLTASTSSAAPSSPSSSSRHASPDRFATGSMLDALTSLASPADQQQNTEVECVPPPLSPLSPYRDASCSSSDSDSLPENSPERVTPRKIQSLPSFDRPANCGYPVPPVANSYLMFASY